MISTSLAPATTAAPSTKLFSSSLRFLKQGEQTNIRRPALAKLAIRSVSGAKPSSRMLSATPFCASSKLQLVHKRRGTKGAMRSLGWGQIVPTDETAPMTTSRHTDATARDRPASRQLPALAMRVRVAQAGGHAMARPSRVLLARSQWASSSTSTSAVARDCAPRLLPPSMAAAITWSCPISM